MSHRGKKPSHPGHRRRTEADDSVMPSMVPPPTVDFSMVDSAAVSNGAVNSLGFSIPILSSRQADMREGLDNITSRLNRTLSQYDNVYKEDEVSWSINFFLKKTSVEEEKRKFQTRYETITARVDTMERERAELLNSMAEPKDTTSTEQSAQSLRDQMLNTKMDFKKLEKINNEKDRLVSQGQDTGLIQEESSRLQMKVVQKFKKMYESKKLSATRRTFGDHWKHASDEIVVLLRRIRSEGTGSIEALGEQLEKAANAIQRQAEEMIRLEGRIREKEQMVEKWSQENAKLTNDNLLLNSEKDKCRDIIKKLKKALIEERRKKGTPTIPDDVDAQKIPRRMPVVPTRQETNQRRNRQLQGRDQERDTGMLCQDCCRDLDRSVQEAEPSQPGDSQAVESGLVPSDEEEHGSYLPSSEVIVLEEENEWLTAKASRLEQTLVEKEMQMMKLELQLSEVMDAVKKSSPQIIKRLSMTDPVDFRNLGLARDANLKTTRPARITEHTPSTQDITSLNQTTSASRNTKNLQVPRGQKTSSKKSAKKRAASNSVKDETPIANQSSQTSLGHKEEISRLTEQRDKLQDDLTTMKGQLMRAQRDLISVKYASTVPGKMGSETSELENQTGQPSSDSLSQTSTTPETISTPRKPTVVKYDDEFQAYAELMQANKDTRPSQTLSRPRRQSKGGHEATQQDQVVAEVGSQMVENEHVHMEEFVTFDQGMQTDPMMDPLGQWSNVPLLKKRRKSSQLPSLVTGTAPTDTDTPTDQAPDAKPPADWTQFDPTGPYTPAMDSKRASISHQMKAGQMPTKLDADGIVSYVERELGRIIQGITGYTDYLKRLIQREVTDMMNINIAIRKQLSETTLQKLDQGTFESIPPSADTGRRSRGLATPIRRGRFEIIKDKNQSSRFATKNAFATIQPAGRRFMHAASPEQQWNFQTRTHTPVFADQVGLWNTFARDHIMAADEAAMERLLPGPSDSLCTRLQKQIEMIGQHSIDVLRGTTVFFRETVTQQMEEYSVLHNTFGIRQEVRVLMTPTPTPTNTLKALQQDLEAERDQPKADNKPLPLKLTRSTSHNSFLEQRNVNYGQPQKKQIHVHIDHDFPRQAVDLHLPMATQSLNSIQSSHRYLPPLTGYENQKPRNRDEMHIPKATLPRRGLVTLQVKEAATTMGQSKVDSKRRCRPVAVSHRGLQSHQRELMGRLGKKPDGDDNQEAGQPLTTILEFKRQLFQTQEEQPSKTSDHTKILDPTELDAEPGKFLPPLENERRRVIIQAQDKLRGPMQHHVQAKYVGFQSDGQE
ncbi:uncharacterized protein LOC117298701 [Asterias rubens]|uniref:uncharacterized protein LOC117298701 n=1 Tax=Asterias rubens TaxID=7604 RepID=UPI001455452D|nr:uncharacterized protein LOC117298701 [Asterias rubens]